MKSFSQLKKNLKNDFSNLIPVRVALLGDTATQLLSVALRGAGFDAGCDLQLWEADHNQVEQQVLDAESELYAFKPDVIILFHSSQKLLRLYDKLSPAGYSSLADDRMQLVKDLCTGIRSASNAKIIYYNYNEIDDAVFGNYSNKIAASFLFQLRKLNYELMLYAEANPYFFICDLSAIQNQAGKATFFQPSVYINTEMVLSIDILPAVARRTVALIGAMYGNIKKCLVVDLDNTIWGGVIGDDGMEHIQIGNLGIGKAFTDFQHWLKKLRNRGVILAVCSKNTAVIAQEPFKKHPDMVLNLDDIAVFTANWDNKVDNINQIKNTLNIGFDAMVFLDDNPFERNMVREHIPAITVPELPEDPANWLEYLYTLNLFETVSFTGEDADRTQQYQASAARDNERQISVNEGEFLLGLNMLSKAEPFNKFNAPRVAQLSQRSNQFNLRTVRYTEADIEALINREGIFTYAFTLEDRFGDNGLISTIVLQKENNDLLFIDTWLMSCRVLKRGMESFVLNTIGALAAENGYKYLKGEYLPTAKNELVKDHYQNLGFSKQDGYWVLDITAYQPKKTFVNSK